jgi:hypothetical protein
LLLNRLAPENDALAGDVVQEFRRRRSRLWYWRQVIGAIVLSSLRELRDHKLLAFRTILIGSTVLWVIGTLIATPLSGAIRAWVLPQLVVAVGFHPVVSLWAFDMSSSPPIAAMYVLTGWIVQQLHRPRGGIVIAFAFTLLITGVVRSTAARLMPMPYPVFFVMWQTVIPTFFVLVGGLCETGNGSADRTGLRA